MSKTRKTITVDAELARLVDERDEFNLSGFVNRCLEQHFSGQTAATPEKAALPRRNLNRRKWAADWVERMYVCMYYLCIL